MSDEHDGRIVRYRCIVHPRNLNKNYGTSVSVLAVTWQEAVERAILVGWAGRASDARVVILEATEEMAREDPDA